MTSRATAVRPSKRASSEHFTAKHDARRNRLTVALVGSRLLEVNDIEMKAQSSVPEVTICFRVSVIARLINTNAKFLADAWASYVRIGCAFLDRPPFFSL